MGGNKEEREEDRNGEGDSSGHKTKEERKTPLPAFSWR